MFFADIVLVFIALVSILALVTMLGSLWVWVPFVPTPRKVVRRMIELAELQGTETIYDLGCGDGRILIEAKKRYPGIRAIGYELPLGIYLLAKINVWFSGLPIEIHMRDFLKVEPHGLTAVPARRSAFRHAGVAPMCFGETRRSRPTFAQGYGGYPLRIHPRAHARGPLLRRRVDLRDADVLFFYLLPEVLPALERKLQAELKPGTKVISHGFPFRGRSPSHEERCPLPSWHIFSASGKKGPRIFVYHW